MIDFEKVAKQIHYPEHWDTAAYPTIESAAHEILMTYDCADCLQEKEQNQKQRIAELEGWQAKARRCRPDINALIVMADQVKANHGITHGFPMINGEKA